MNPRIRRWIARLVLLSGAACAFPVSAQRSSEAVGPSFVFASVAQGKVALGARDDYVRATTPLERSAKLKTAEPVDEARFIRHMQSAAMEWTDEQKKNLSPLVGAMTRFLKGVRWKMPDRILLTQANATLEEGFPHTRGNTIMVPALFYQRGPGTMAYVLSHETFHVLTRHNHALREELYAAIGFRRCETVEVPAEVVKLRITNPDAVESRHTLSAKYKGRPVEALPYLRFNSGSVDPRGGLMKQLQVAWLLVDRKGTACHARGGSVTQQELEGVYEQVGRNTEYLLHPEEILADNFVHLFLASMRAPEKPVPSPEIPEKMRKILFN